MRDDTERPTISDLDGKELDMWHASIIEHTVALMDSWYLAELELRHIIRIWKAELAILSTDIYLRQSEAVAYIASSPETVASLPRYRLNVSL